MAAVHGSNTRVLAGGVDLSTYLNSTDIAGELDTAEVTAYQADSKAYIAGSDSGSVTFAGMHDATLENEVSAHTQSADGEPWLYGPDGLAVGSRIVALTGRQTSYKSSAPVGDKVAVAISVQGDGGVHRGVSLHDVIAAETAAGSAAGNRTGDGLPTQGGYRAQVHLLAFTGTSITVIVQHSTTDASYIDLATLAAVSAAGDSATVEATATTVDRWLRCTWSGTFTTATFAVSLSRR